MSANARMGFTLAAIVVVVFVVAPFVARWLPGPAVTTAKAKPTAAQKTLPTAGWSEGDPLAGLDSPDATTRRFVLDQTRISNWIHGYYRSGPATAEQKAAAATRLRQALKDDSAEVRLAAAELIERTGGDLGLKPDEAVPVCEALIAESSTGPTPYVTALAAIGPDSLPALTDLIRSKNPGVRNDAANGIGRLGPEVRSKATPVLRAVIEQEKVGWVKETALNALGKVNPDAAKQLGWYER